VDTFQLLACSFSTRRHRTLFLFFSGSIRRQKSGSWLKATSILFFLSHKLRYLTPFRASVFPQLQFNHCLCWLTGRFFLTKFIHNFCCSLPKSYPPSSTLRFVRVCSPRCFLYVKPCALFAGNTSGVILLRLMFLF